MATLEVQIKYQTLLSRTLFWVLTLSFPIWVLLPLAVGFCSYFVGSGFYKSLPDALLLAAQFLRVYGAGALPLFVLGLWSWLISRNHHLVLSQQGIVFPVLSCLTLWGRRNRPWYDLKQIRIARVPGTAYKKAMMVMSYKSGGHVSLPLSAFSHSDIEQIILGIENFADDASGLEFLPFIKNELKEELKLEGINSYTNLWEDELRYRYASTTFIPLSPGATLQEGQIKVLRQLGFGGLSAIYLVQRNNRELAILKESVLPQDVDCALKRKAEEQFDREAKILAGLEHKQIARVLDYFVERGHYLLLEYIHGQDLRQYVNEKGALAEPEVLEFALQIADILQYLHTREIPIIHRDLTPENLIVNDGGKIVLIDFGAANEFLHTATGTLVGKHAYMAPEQLKGKADTRSDLYALGGTMHFLLTGKDPIPLEASQTKRLKEDLSVATDALIYKLTQLDKSKRMQSAAEVRKSLEIIIGAS